MHGNKGHEWNTKPLLIGGSIITGLVADNVTVIGFANDALIPVAIAGTAITVVTTNYEAIGASISNAWNNLWSSSDSGDDLTVDEGVSGAQTPSAPRAEDGYFPPKNWSGKKVKNPNGPGYGYPYKHGNVWVPTSHNGTHAPHWDVQHPDGSHTPVYPRR